MKMVKIAFYSSSNCWNLNINTSWCSNGKKGLNKSWNWILSNPWSGYLTSGYSFNWSKKSLGSRIEL